MASRSDCMKKFQIARPESKNQLRHFELPQKARQHPGFSFCDMNWKM